MRIHAVRANHRRRAFELRTSKGEYSFPFARLEVRPSRTDRVREAFPDEEAGGEAFTYRLESGAEDTVHIDAVLDYHRDPAYLNELLFHRLTVEVRKAVEESDLSKRELIRTLGTSASQFYRLLDPTYNGKSVGQMLALLRLLGRDVELVVRPSAAARPCTTFTGTGGRSSSTGRWAMVIWWLPPLLGDLPALPPARRPLPPGGRPGDVPAGAERGRIAGGAGGGEVGEGG